MNNHPSSSGDLQKSSQESLSNKNSERVPAILRLWYRFTSPPEPNASASFQERELFRRGRTGSQICIFLFLLIFVSFPAAFAGSNALLVVILTINLLSLVFALILNRLRRVNTAGILVVLGVVLSPTANILTTPGGVNTSALPIFGFLVLPLMCAASFLPPVWVFVVALANCLFTLYVLRFVPSTGELHQVLNTAFPGIVTPIVLSQGIVSVVAYLWVRGAKQAILRADRAEEIASLEKREIEQQLVQIKQKEQLDADIQLIMETHVKVANGDFAARAPLGKENVLWRIAYSLNNLLARLQSYSQMQDQYQRLQKENYRLNTAVQQKNASTLNELQGMKNELQSTKNELQRTRDAANHLVELLKRSNHGDIPTISLRSGTIIDGIAGVLNNSTGKKQDLS